MKNTMNLQHDDIKTLCVIFNHCMHNLELFPESPSTEEFKLMLQFARESILDIMEDCGDYDENLTDLLKDTNIKHSFM